MKSILLTGATGFIGSHLLEKLIELKYNVVVLKRSFSDTWRIKHLLDDSDNVNKIKSYDIDKTPIEKIFKQNSIDVVIHIATYYKKAHVQEDIEPMINANVSFPVKLLEQMQLNSVKCFINTGTFFEYETSSSKAIDETQKIKPFNLYAVTKTTFSEFLKYYAENHSIKAVELKLFSPYGPEDNEKLIPFMIKNFLNNSCFDLTKGEQKLDWTFVEDIIQAYVLAFKFICNDKDNKQDKQDKKDKQNYEVFNIGYGSPKSIKQLVAVLEKISGRKNLANFSRPYPLNEIFYSECDNSKAKKILGWKPKYDISKGLKETYKYYSKE